MKEQIHNFAQQKQETIQSAISYGTGGGMVGFASIADVANYAQSIGLILGCLVIAIRLIHDAIHLYRFIKNPKYKKNDRRTAPKI